MLFETKLIWIYLTNIRNLFPSRKDGGQMLKWCKYSQVKLCNIEWKSNWNIIIRSEIISRTNWTNLTLTGNQRVSYPFISLLHIPSLDYCNAFTCVKSKKAQDTQVVYIFRGKLFGSELFFLHERVKNDILFDFGQPYDTLVSFYCLKNIYIYDLLYLNKKYIEWELPSNFAIFLGKTI